jgi:spore germination cell wall hydrolase CwlJ-like protein
MKQKRSRAAKRNSAKPSVRKVGTLLGSSALCVLTVGTISVCGLLGRNAGAEAEIGRETKAANVNTTDTARDEGAYTALDTVTWRKASINEYEFGEVSAPETTAVTEAGKKTSSSRTETTTSATEKKTSKESVKAETEQKTKNKVKSISKTFLYVESPVNLRAEPSKSAEALEVLDTDTRVVVDGCTDDGVWYSVRHGEIKGYAMAEYFTGKTPDSKKTGEKKDKESDEKEDKTVIKLEDKDSKNTVISYTDDEFEMLCYVLQGEVGNCSEASKIAVANVIINRVKSSQFPDTISAVLTAPEQFDAIYGYYYGTTVPTQNTRDCALRALQGEDNTNGATYYYAPRYCGGATSAWFETLQFCLEVDGQRYFKNW